MTYKEALKLPEVLEHRKKNGDHLLPSLCDHCGKLIRNQNGEITYHYNIHNSYTRFCPSCRI